MKCKYCGKTLSQNAVRCPYCRQVQSQERMDKISQDTDLFVNMNRKRKEAAANPRRKIPKLTKRQQMFPYLMTLAASVVLCVLLVYTSQVWGAHRMSSVKLSDYGITAESVEQSIEAKKAEESVKAAEAEPAEDTTTEAAEENRNAVGEIQEDSEA